jgi:hypothetical protein
MIVLLEFNREMPLMNLRDTQALPQAREIENEQTNAWRHQLKSNEKLNLGKQTNLLSRIERFFARNKLPLACSERV